MTNITMSKDDKLEIDAIIENPHAKRFTEKLTVH